MTDIIGTGGIYKTSARERDFCLLKYLGHFHYNQDNPKVLCSARE